MAKLVSKDQNSSQMTTRASLPLSVQSPEAAAAKNRHKTHTLWEEQQGQHHPDQGHNEVAPFYFC